MSADSVLTLTQLRDAVRGPAAAIRLRVKLQPAGGAGDKIAPPTYSDAKYAEEERHIGGNVVKTVLIDSVQSQANRQEQALLAAVDAKAIQIPLLQVMFSDFPDIGRLTTLDAPHRIADAIFRDSLLNGRAFRPQPRVGGKPFKDPISPEGEAFAQANLNAATSLFELCPTALIYGMWDSTGSAGGLGNKFARAVVSEIVGMDAVKGVRTSSRLDPLKIEKGDIYESTDGGFIVDPKSPNVRKDEKGLPMLFKRGGKDSGRPSEINHGNIVPDVTEAGYTISHALQTWTLSLPTLRRLLFPVKDKVTPEINLAARTVLAALALAGITHLRDEFGYNLRSRCDLIVDDTDGEPLFEMVTTTTKVTTFRLAASHADTLLREAVAAATKLGLPWRTEPITLTPRPELVDLVRRSRELASPVAE